MIAIDTVISRRQVDAFISRLRPHVVGFIGWGA